MAEPSLHAAPPPAIDGWQPPSDPDREPPPTALAATMPAVDRRRRAWLRELAIACATVWLGAGTVAGCQPTNDDPALAGQVSAIAGYTVITPEQTPVYLDKGERGSAYRVRLGGQDYVFKRVTGVNVSTDLPLEAEAVDKELANRMPLQYGGPPGADGAYRAIVRNFDAMGDAAGVVEPFIDGTTLAKATAVTETQLVALENYSAMFQRIGVLPSDFHSKNIYIASDGVNVYFKDMKPLTITGFNPEEPPAMMVARMNSLAEYIATWRDINAGRLPVSAAADLLGTPGDADVLGAEAVVTDAPPSAATTNLNNTVQTRWNDEVGALEQGNLGSAGAAVRTAAVSFGTGFLAYAAQLAVINALTPPNQGWVWDIDDAFTAIDFNIASGICNANPLSPLCSTAGLQLVTLTDGIQKLHAWQYTAYGFDANDVVTFQENGSFAVYNKVSAILTGTMFPPGTTGGGTGSTYAQSQLVNFVARPCPAANPSSPDRLYVITETGPSIGIRTVNGLVQNNVIVEVPGDGTCHLPCNDYSNRRTCIEQGGSCGPDAMGISQPCYVPGPGGVGARQIGTCADGVSFDGVAAPSCNNPGPAACVNQCRSVHGYLDKSQRCWTTEPSQFPGLLSAQHDVTISTSCTDYPCNPYDNQATCGEVGGFCTSGGACVEDNLTSTGGSTLGTCQAGGAFNAAFTKPVCSFPGGPGGPVCEDDCSCCESSACLQACDDQQLSSLARLSHQWLYIDMAGTGTGTVAESSRGATRTRRTAMTVPGPTSTVVLTAQPAPGSSFVSWSGDCASVSGPQCAVASDRTRSVMATFTAAPIALAISGVYILGWDATTVTGELVGTFAPSGNQVNMICNAGGFPAVFNSAVTYNSASILYFLYPRVYGPGSPYHCQVRVSAGTSTSPYVTLSGFADLPDSDPVAPFAYQVFDQAIMPACATSPLSFCPGAGMTRSDAAAFLIRAAFGENFAYTWAPYFDDVPYYDPDFKYVQKLRDLGITTGCGTRLYCGASPASRSDLAVFVIRAIQAKNGKPVSSFGYPPTPYFSDVPATDPRFPYVQAMRAAGITTGCTATTFCATDAASRGQLAVFIGRGLLSNLTLPDP